MLVDTGKLEESHISKGAGPIDPRDLCFDAVSTGYDLASGDGEGIEVGDERGTLAWSAKWAGRSCWAGDSEAVGFVGEIADAIESVLSAVLNSRTESGQVDPFAVQPVTARGKKLVNEREKTRQNLRAMQ